MPLSQNQPPAWREAGFYKNPYSFSITKIICQLSIVQVGENGYYKDAMNQNLALILLGIQMPGSQQA